MQKPHIASQAVALDREGEIVLQNVPQTTGRYLVLFRDDAGEAGFKQLASTMRVARAQDFKESMFNEEQVGDCDAVYLDRLNAAIVAAEPDRFSPERVTSGGDSAILAVEPEYVMYAFNTPSNYGMAAVDEIAEPLPEVFESPTPEPQLQGLPPLEYLRGYRDAVNSLYDRLTGADGAMTANRFALPRPLPRLINETSNTWGVQVTRVVRSTFSGRGIKVAVLDTGMDLNHPDFQGRRIVSSSFVPGEAVQDQHGHGTHCIGTACGPKTPPILPRYGAAYECDIYAGKVLSNGGSGASGWILAGINWAVANGCQVISMSLGSAVAPGQSYSTVYEAVAQRALRAGTLIVAAAGNDSARNQNIFRPVGSPANCPSIMAVAALSSDLSMAWYSNRGINGNGGQIDIAGPGGPSTRAGQPGLAVYSSWPMPRRYNRISGTSMATPHVAGIAALFAQATGQRGAALWALLQQRALRLNLPSADVGAGLVQAP